MSRLDLQETLENVQIHITKVKHSDYEHSEYLTVMQSAK